MAKINFLRPERFSNLILKRFCLVVNWSGNFTKSIFYGNDLLSEIFFHASETSHEIFEEKNN